MKIYNNTTLNSVFTEEEIMKARFLVLCDDERVNEILIEVDQIELEDFNVSKENRLVDFLPSERLLNKIKEACLYRLVEEFRIRKLFHMIEANTEVFSGKGIEVSYRNYKNKNETDAKEAYDLSVMSDIDKGIKDNRVIEKFESLGLEKRWRKIAGGYVAGVLETRIPSIWKTDILFDNLPTGLIGEREDYEGLTL